MRRNICLLFAGLIFSMTGCSYKDLSEKMIPKAESRYAKEYLQKVRDRDFDYVRSQLHPDLLKQVPDEKLLEIAEYFPKGELISTEIIGSNVHTMNDRWQGNFTFEYQFSDGWILANVVMRRENDKTAVVGFHVYRTKASQKDLNSFNSVTPSVKRIVLVLLTFMVPIFMLVTCVAIYRTPIPSRKWPWYIAAFAGIGLIALNWTSGEITVKILTIRLLSFGASQISPYAPWIFQFTIPIGGIIFWLKRNDFVAQAKALNQMPPADAPETGEKSRA